METTRAGIAIYKINYQSDFILTVVCDVEWGTPFCIKFWTGEPAQAYYVGWDGNEYRNCKVVESDQSKLLVLFDDHHLPVGELKMQIAYHTTIDDFPNAIVDEVTNSMKVMAYIDGKNQKVALDFEGEEAAELQFELPAYANEAQRIANEEQRIANEQARIEAEQQRIDNEQTRQNNEAQRIAKETARVNEYAGLKADVVAATTAANDAATLATQQAQLAVDKAALADAAATLANQKAQLAADKAALADAAATLANQKAALAQQKAEYADAQGDYAKEQGDYAKEQGDTALADHRRAESDHETAASDHTQAGNDHTRAESDHSTAADDHTLAASDHSTAADDHTLAASDHSTATADHTLAASDHSTAADDHTQAGNDHTRAESDHTRAESDHASVEVYVDSLGAFDISSYHATGGVLAKYADLTAALGTNGANIPEAIRKGGMSVKFVQSSDNKYVQYRLMHTLSNISTATADFVNTVNWQGIDVTPTAGSSNLVMSDGIYKELSNVNDKIGTEETFTYNELCGMRFASNSVIAASNIRNGIIIPLTEGATYDLLTSGVSYVTFTSLPAIGVTSNIGRIVTIEPTITVLEGEKYILATITVSDTPSVSVKRHEMNLSKRVTDLETSVAGFDDTIEDVTEDISALKTGNIVITKIDLTPFTTLTADKYIRTDKTTLGGGATYQDCYCAKIAVTAGQTYRITGLGGSLVLLLWATAASDNTIIRRSAISLDARQDPAIVTIENGESYLAVNLTSYNEQTDKIEELIIEQYTPNDLKDDVEELKDVSLTLKTKKIVCFGDSIWEFTDSNGKGIVEYLKDFTGSSTIYKGAIGGSRLVVRRTPVENPTDAFGAYAELDISYLVNAWATNNWTYVDNAVTWLKNNTADDNTKIIQNLKSCPIESADIVLITGGTNDYKSGVALGTPSDTPAIGTTSCAALLYAIQSILSVNPKIKVFYMSPIVRYVENTNPPQDENWSDVWENTNGVTLATSSDTLRNAAKTLHTPSCDLYWELGWNKINFLEFFNSTDLTHPYKGFKQIAQKVYTYLISHL